MLLYHVVLIEEGPPGPALLLGLSAGVPVFFVISGFLLYRPFVASRLGVAPQPQLRRYTRRRVLRIFPAYWVALTVLAIYPGLPGVFTDRWWVFYGLVQNYSPSEQFHGLLQAWSLSVEFTFYILLIAPRSSRGASRGAERPVGNASSRVR